MNKQMQKGFTLIELMVVIVIIGILAAIAIPSYLDNANRAKITEGINLMSPVKSSIAESYIGAGVMPSNHGQAGLLSNSSEYAAGVVLGIGWTQSTPSTGLITITYDDSKLGQGVTATSNTLVFAAAGSANGVQWNCRNTPVTSPSAIPAATGTLPEKYRPQNCRG